MKPKPAQVGPAQAMGARPVAASLFALLATQLGEDPAQVLTDSSKVSGLAETLGGLALAANLAEQTDVKKAAELL